VGSGKLSGVAAAAAAKGGNEGQPACRPHLRLRSSVSSSLLKHRLSEAWAMFGAKLAPSTLAAGPHVLECPLQVLGRQRRSHGRTDGFPKLGGAPFGRLWQPPLALSIAWFQAFLELAHPTMSPKPKVHVPQEGSSQCRHSGLGLAMADCGPAPPQGRLQNPPEHAHIP